MGGFHSFRAAWILAGAITLGACNEAAVYTCTNDEQCGADGSCEQSGFCSFPDGDCPTMRRYDRFAGAGNANKCLDDGSAAEDSSENTSPSLDESTTEPPSLSATASGASELDAEGDVSGASFSSLNTEPSVDSLDDDVNATADATGSSTGSNLGSSGIPDGSTSGGSIVGTCDDELLNQDETATDCGGICGSTCIDGASCGTGSDCISGVCEGDLCRPPSARCDDGTTNGAETDVDCGGTDAGCPRCADGDSCLVDPDCVSDQCDDGTCVSCTDDRLSGEETDVDCGGPDPTCPGCGDGDRCVVPGDCASNQCAGGRCVSCVDGLTNGQETDRDCGGSVCDPCDDGDLCVLARDCESNRCSVGRCVSCTDGILNGDESARDCGGSCPACEPGDTCRVDADCDRNACVDGTCCGGTEADCTRCAERLSLTVNCNSPGVPANDATNCAQMLVCLADNIEVCSTRRSPGCSEDPGGACNPSRFGGGGGGGVRQVDRVLANASCEI